ncbi:hypothetical protein H7F37_12570 [Winogradskyella sp. PAMC22761]|nr:hypothetical protein H7F37_12570 [Winogradskyella sp. PAMC22761]
MKSILNLLGAFLICTTTCFAQVGIGTENPDASSILELQSTEGGLLLPRMTTTERDLIASPAEGLTIYNTTTQGLEIYTDSWKSLAVEVDTPVLTMYSPSPGTIDSANNTFYNLPLGVGDIVENNSEYFNVLSDGKIEILKDGSYLINASWSVSNFKSGETKYIFAVFVDDARTAYLSRGVANLSGTDHFGVTGTFQNVFTAGQVLDVKYFLNAVNNSSTLNGTYAHIGIVKL